MPETTGFRVARVVVLAVVVVMVVMVIGQMTRTQSPPIIGVPVNLHGSPAGAPFFLCNPCTSRP